MHQNKQKGMTHEGKAVQKNTSISADDMCRHSFWLCGTGTRQTAFHAKRSHQSGQQKAVMHRFPAFFSKDAAVTKDYVIQLEQKLKTALQEASEDTSDVNGRTLVDCYSTKGNLPFILTGHPLRREHSVLEEIFFTFHPLKLLSGAYFDGEDLNKDGVVIDENVAWQLFGSNNVAGMYVEINGVQYPVRGVVKSDKGYFSDAADEEAKQPFMSLMRF